ncbi:MAG TPA: universal stress protein [Nitrospirales bacterium]|nr:universal stress protein [Nitrospirales bacterium]
MKVLLAVDKSLHAALAVQTLKQCYTATEVEILHVLDLEAIPHPHLSAALIDWYHKKIRSLLEAEANQFLPKFQAVLVPVFQNVCVSVREGRTADVILKTAASSGASLIVIGSRGLSTIQSLLLGGVTYRVVHEATCPVLVVRREMTAIRKILLAVDRSQGAEHAVRFLAEQSLFHPCPVVAVTVCPSPPFAELLPESVRRYGLAAASEYLREVGDRLSARGYAVELRVVEDDPAVAILGQANAEGIDLVVIGSRGLHGLRRLLLGSVSRKVLAYTTKSVLIVPGGSTQAGLG